MNFIFVKEEFDIEELPKRIYWTDIVPTNVKKSSQLYNWNGMWKIVSKIQCFYNFLIELIFLFNCHRLIN